MQNATQKLTTGQSTARSNDLELGKQVILQKSQTDSSNQNRTLNLDDIKTQSLRGMSPSAKEIESLKRDRTEALAEYADRLRQEYKENSNGLRNGFRALSDAFENGDRIAISCSCRSGEMCHADVVKMAIEKVNFHLKNKEADRESTIERTFASLRPTAEIQVQTINPRTQRAINEILSVNENDRTLGAINQTEGRNRGEQSSFLGERSQFIRDLYERGANANSGNLIVPVERTKISDPPLITTQEYGVQRIGKILKDDSKAKEIAPTIIEYADKIAGQGADGETKLKVFTWIYDSLEGKAALIDAVDQEHSTEPPTFETTLEKIGFVASELHSLEPSSDDALTKSLEAEKEQNESFASIATIEFERIDLDRDIPQIPVDYSKSEIDHLVNVIIPEVDQKLESGIVTNEILKPYNENIRQSANENAFRKLEKVYEANGKSESVAESFDSQVERIELNKQNVLEISRPHEFYEIKELAVKAFYRKSIQESARVISKLDEIRELSAELKSDFETKQFKNELTRIQESKPSFAFKLKSSPDIIVGIPSKESVVERNFIASFINFQLKNPESKLRHENERYRNYALQLETQTTKSGLAKTASEIRAENAALGLKWKDLEKFEKEKYPRPLTQNEMQFLFTESSPTHFTTEMTALKLSFSHSGASRHSMTESLKKGELKPSPEAAKLIESLESRLNRRDIKDSISATKHFFESIKTPNESLRNKNAFDHREIYTSLPPFEKDFVYQKATETLSNLKITAEKPLSLRLFECEFKKAEKDLIDQNLTEKRTDSVKLANGLKSETLLTQENREQTRALAIETVIEKLEPRELSLVDPKMPRELTRQAIRTARQLERAGVAFSSYDKTSTIRESFLELDREAAKLRNLREEFHKSNQIELLKNSIKQDVVDLLKETAGKSESKLESRFSEILSENLTRGGLIDKRDITQQANRFAVRINEKLVTKQLELPVLGNPVEMSPRTNVGETKQYESNEIQRQFQSRPSDTNRNAMTR